MYIYKSSHPATGPISRQRLLLVARWVRVSASICPLWETIMGAILEPFEAIRDYFATFGIQLCVFEEFETISMAVLSFVFNWDDSGSHFETHSEDNSAHWGSFVAT